jgi:hypothetical protein
MSVRRHGLAFFLGALFVTVPLFAADTLFPIYKKYEKAIEQGDAAGAKFFLSSGRREQLSGKSAGDALAEMDVLSPKKDLRKHDEIFDGDDATLVVVADVSGTESTGRVQFVKEQGTWKILAEMWDLGGSPDDTQPPDNVRQPENDQQREALRKLRELGFPSPTADFLVMSAVEGNLEAVKLFVAAGYSPDTKDRGSPAIVSAAMFGQPHVVQYLIEAGADVNATDDVNTTALMRLADKCEATDTIRLLLKSGARTDLLTAGGVTAAQLAGYASCTENLAVIKGAKKKK